MWIWISFGKLKNSLSFFFRYLWECLILLKYNYTKTNIQLIKERNCDNTIILSILLVSTIVSIRNKELNVKKTKFSETRSESRFLNMKLNIFPLRVQVLMYKQKSVKVSMYNKIIKWSFNFSSFWFVFYFEWMKMQSCLQEKYYWNLSFMMAYTIINSLYWIIFLYSSLRFRYFLQV